MNTKYKNNLKTIDTNQKLVKHYLLKLFEFINKINTPIRDSINKFKTQMPSEIWEQDSLVLIKYSHGDINLVINQHRAPDHPYPYLIIDMLKKSIRNKKILVNEFEIIFTWDDETLFPVAINSIANQKCKEDSQCVSAFVKNYTTIYLQTPIFMFSKDEKGRAHRYIEAEKNIFILPDLYIYFRHSHKTIKNSGFVNCYEMDIKDDTSYAMKIDKAFFIGSSTSSRFFSAANFMNFTINDPELDNHLRLKFKAISIHNPSLLDVRIINLCDKGKINEWNSLEKSICTKLYKGGFNVDQRMDFHDIIKYKYLLSIDGHTAAWCRLPAILNSNSILLKVDGTTVEWFYPAMKPYVHYIPCPDNENGVIKTINFIKHNASFALDIIKNAHQFVQTFLTEIAIEEFTSSLVSEYANHYLDTPHKIHQLHTDIFLNENE